MRFELDMDQVNYVLICIIFFFLLRKRVSNIEVRTRHVSIVYFLDFTPTQHFRVWVKIWIVWVLLASGDPYKPPENLIF